MSRLIDKFQKASQSSLPPMGFRTSRSAPPEPGLLLIVSAAPDAIKNSADIGNASGVLVRPDASSVTAENIKNMVEIIPDIPVGLYLEDADDKETAAAAGAGGDFLVFPASSRISPAPADKKTGRIIQVESAMDDSLLRAVNSLPVDAVLVADTFAGGALVWHQLMIFQHLANLIAKPLIVNIPSDITGAELKALWEAGVDGVVVEASTLKASGLKKLREAIGKLPPRSARKRGKIEALLPRISGEGLTPAPPDEEEEEDE
jgi:hypothetical protein